MKNSVNCDNISFSLCLKDDCLTSLTRFASAHWTVSSLSAVQGHFCTLLACKFATLFFSSPHTKRKMLTDQEAVFPPVYLCISLYCEKNISLSLQFQHEFQAIHVKLCWFIYFSQDFSCCFWKGSRVKKKEVGSFTKEKLDIGIKKKKIGS